MMPRLIRSIVLETLGIKCNAIVAMKRKDTGGSMLFENALNHEEISLDLRSCLSFLIAFLRMVVDSCCLFKYVELVGSLCWDYGTKELGY